MLDSIRASLIGRQNYPHQHFLATGAHSITLVGHGNASQNQLEQRARDMVWILEKLVRIHDQLDEQLHAGYYFYILTSPSKFVSNAVFIWPIVLLVFGVCLPVWLEHITHCEQNTVDSHSKVYAFFYVLWNYVFGALIFHLPFFLFGEHHQRDTCLAQTPELRELRETVLE